MALQQCTICGRQWTQYSKGRPRNSCPEDGRNEEQKAIHAEAGNVKGRRWMDVNGRPFIVNQKPGTCSHYQHGSYCSVYVPARAGWAIRMADRSPWEVRCQNHRPMERSGQEPVPGTSPIQGPSATPTPTPAPVAATVDIDAIVEKVLDRLPTPDPIDHELLTKVVTSTLPDVLATMRAVPVELTINGASVPMPVTHHPDLPEIIHCLSLGHHVYLVGPAGSGKSTMAKQAAKALGLPFGSMQLGPNSSTVKVFGYNDANGNYQTTEYRKVYECKCEAGKACDAAELALIQDDGADPAVTKALGDALATADKEWNVACQCGGIMLIDEMDRCHPGTLTELNQSLANDCAAFADRMVRRGRRFRAFATGNTFGRGPSREYGAATVLDKASTDRFTIFEVMVDDAMERTLAMAYARPGDGGQVAKWVSFVQHCRNRIMDLGVHEVVSPRAAVGGAQMLATGMKWERVVELRLFRGIKADVVAQITAGWDGGNK